MTATMFGESSRFVRYLSELVQLRLSVEQNISDSRSHHQLVYIVDANIIHLFLSPYSNWQNVIPFKEILGQEKPNLAFSAAVITAEYIFSRQLSRQARYPVFVAEEHVLEVDRYISKLRDESLAPQAVGIERAKALENAIASISDLRNKLLTESSDNLRREFESRIPDAVAEFQSVAFALQYTRLLRNDLVRPLRLAPHLDRKWLQVERLEYEKWCDALSLFQSADKFRLHRSGVRSERGQSEPPLHDNLKRDARVLSQLVQINSQLQERRVPVRFVFVTDDDKIHHAVAYRAMHKRFQDTLLRRPVQFHPALNFQEMPNLLRKSDVTNELLASINGIIDGMGLPTKSLYELTEIIANYLRDDFLDARDLDEADWRSRLQLVWRDTLVKKFDLRVPPDVEGDIDEVRSAWDRLSGNSIGLNVELLARRYKEEIGPLADGLRQLERFRAVELAEAFDDFQREQLDVLERHHIEWCLSWLIDSRQKSQTEAEARGPRLFRMSDLRSNPQSSVESAVLSLMKSVDHDDGARRARLVVREGRFTDNAIVAAIVAYLASEWSLAREFGERSLDRLRRTIRVAAGVNSDTYVTFQPAVREIEYLVAVCKRFELCMIDEADQKVLVGKKHVRDTFKSAERTALLAIDDAVQRFDVFGAARANAELGTLYLTAIQVEHVCKQYELLDRQDWQRLPSKATEHLRRAISDLETHFPEIIASSEAPESENELLAWTLFFQANVNLLSAVLFFRLEGFYKEYVPNKIMDLVLKYLPAKLKSFPEHLTVEWEIYNFLYVEGDLHSPKSRNAIISRCKDMLSRREETLTSLDASILNRYIRHIGGVNP
ncbi:hypothetical protein [Bradyrhizobium sp. 1]|uniref:hypothetical protein n=1 Tax=Bradyrhizobium sp. 1 TaxID=241591 RepID=UPI001FFB0268|nr:hypothetical protein [Bradyrhizobium sp. 1]MCK1391478.1 hypothetical protein [Bradyrhizobium sp. 1]